MKNWTIDEFLAECEALCRDQYGYDYSRMPEGVCNGHTVKPYFGSWHSIVIDGHICNMAAYDDKHPNGSATYCVKGKVMTALEYVRMKIKENTRSPRWVAVQDSLGKMRACAVYMFSGFTLAECVAAELSRTGHSETEYFDEHDQCWCRI